MIGHIDSKGNYVKTEHKNLTDDRNTMYRAWSHDQQRAEFARERIQPRIGGKINPEFVRAYPEYSRNYFTQAERDAAVRET